MTSIFYETFPIGQLTFSDQWHLDYDPTWVSRRSAFPISLAIPLQSTPVGAERLLPWLANLLPETHLAEIGQQLKVSPQDVVGLLEHMGRDTAGALSIGAPRKAGINLQPISNDAALERILNELPEKPFLIGERGVSMSLAGVQEKLPVFVDKNGDIAIPLDGTPSTHIIKPDTKRLVGSVENEAFCLMLAAACGLRSAAATVKTAGRRRYLLVERYDRFTDAQGTIRRLHQEDLCQLTGFFPSHKYERGSAGRGVTLQAMFNAINDFVSPAERLKLLDGVIFNVLICNSDSHAKNYSVLIGASGSAELAPFYDLMCAAIYRNIDQSLPQSIAGRFIAAELRGEDWKALAQQLGLSGASTLRRVDELSELVMHNSDTVADEVNNIAGDPTSVLERVNLEVKKKARRIQRQL